MRTLLLHSVIVFDSEQHSHDDTEPSSLRTPFNSIHTQSEIYTAHQTFRRNSRMSPFKFGASLYSQPRHATTPTRSITPSRTPSRTRPTALTPTPSASQPTTVAPSSPPVYKNLVNYAQHTTSTLARYADVVLATQTDRREFQRLVDEQSKNASVGYYGNNHSVC